jgi:DNA helicase-2/ATP-dependent DNA helicase PcrA
MLYGRTNAALPSRFLKEIPEEYIVKKGGYRQQPVQAGYANNRDFNYRPSPMREAMRQEYRKSEQSAVVSATQNTSYMELNKGDMVQHAAFGRGLVLSVMKMGGDALLEIAFDQIGTKKLMAKTASVHMKKLS